MIAVGSFLFPPRGTLAAVRVRVIDGRLCKQVLIRALFDGYTAAAPLRAELDALHAALEQLDAGAAVLSLIPGRHYYAVRRDDARWIDPSGRLAAVRLELLTRDRFERSNALHTQSHLIMLSGFAFTAVNAGTAPARPRLELEAHTALDRPAVGDGARTVRYLGALAPGDVLSLDSEDHTARLNGVNALDAIAGVFPLLAPGATTLTYSDAAGSGQALTLRLAHRDTWA